MSPYREPAPRAPCRCRIWKLGFNGPPSSYTLRWQCENCGRWAGTLDELLIAFGAVLEPDGRVRRALAGV